MIEPGGRDCQRLVMNQEAMKQWAGKPSPVRGRASGPHPHPAPYGARLAGNSTVRIRRPIVSQAPREDLAHPLGLGYDESYWIAVRARKRTKGAQRMSQPTSGQPQPNPKQPPYVLTLREKNLTVQQLLSQGYMEVELPNKQLVDLMAQPLFFNASGSVRLFPPNFIVNLARLRANKGGGNYIYVIVATVWANHHAGQQFGALHADRSFASVRGRCLLHARGQCNRQVHRNLRSQGLSSTSFGSCARMLGN